MKKILLVSMILCFMAAGAAFAATPSEVIKQAEDVLRGIIDNTDRTMLSGIVRNGHGVAIVPRAMGNQTAYGLVLEREDGVWYGPSFFEFNAASAGYRTNNQITVLFINLNDWKGVDLFAARESVIGSGNGVIAGPLFDNQKVPHASAYSYDYSLAKGLMNGVSLNNFPIRTNLRMNREYWGKMTSAEDALTMSAERQVAGLVSLLNHITESVAVEEKKEEEKKGIDLREEGRNLLKKLLEEAARNM